MTEHEKLKEVCELIGYKSKFEYKNYRNNKEPLNYFTKAKNRRQNSIEYIKVNPREIIFTQEFMKSIIRYLVWKAKWETIIVNWGDFMENLDDPVEYLYNLLK